MKIAVIGAGQMGNGIAHVFAQHKHDVNLVDLDQIRLDKALLAIGTNLERQVKKELITDSDKKDTLSRLHAVTALSEAVGDRELVIEAATEKTDLKLKIFTELDASTPVKTILASNTSSISITKIAAATNRPEKVIGMHFMNPVPVMKLVEIIRGYGTSDETTNHIYTLSQKLSKVPVIVHDYPGFVSNRILMPMLNEAIYALFEGVAGVEEIDTVMKLGMAHPMGPLQLADFIGLDTCESILEVLYEGFGNPKYAPCPLLKNMVAANHLGAKTGKGFYDWSQGNKNLTVSDYFIK